MHQTEAGFRVMRQSIESGSSPEVLVEQPSKDFHSPQDITPDGHYLFLCQLTAGGIEQIDLTKPLGSGRIETVVPKGFRARISPDGRSLIFTGDTQYYSLPYPLTAEQPREIASFSGPA